MSAANRQFMLTFKGAHASWNGKSEAEWQELRRQYNTWMENLKGYKSAAKLASAPTKILSGGRGRTQVLDGPFSETKEVLTGFYVIEARDMDHAVELAKGCPWLIHDTMEIFEVEE